VYQGTPFIRELSIKNLRCFTDTDIRLSIPSGEAGSGLNLFVGNNGSGKTSVLDAYDYLFGGRFKGESRLSIRDLTDFEIPICISGVTERYSVLSDLQSYRNKYFNCVGLEFQAKARDRKQAGKLLSGPISAKSSFSLDENAYYNRDGDELYVKKSTGDARAVDPRELTLDTRRLGPNGLDVFYFDKNRARHLTSGTYRTTFDAICDDLNWKFQKKLREKGSAGEFAKNVGNLFSDTIELAQKGTGDKLGVQFSEFFGDPKLSNLRFELMSLLEPFSSSFLALRNDGDIHQVPTKSLGSGIELVLALLLQRFLSDGAKGSKVFLIDEPEMHLHPNAQRKLAELLIEEARTSQVLLSSHSPYMLQLLLSHGLTNVFTSNERGTVEIEAQDGKAGDFPWSPSFGEVNFKAFSMSTREYHNELYGWLQESNNAFSSRDIDNVLVSKGIPKNKKWTRSPSGKEETVTVCTFVRHAIHHPENTLNGSVDEAQLTESIEKMLSVI